MTFCMRFISGLLFVLTFCFCRAWQNSVKSSSCLVWSPRARLLAVKMEMLRFMPEINQPSLPTPFYSVLVSVSVFMALSTAFHSITSPGNPPVFSLRSSGLISALLVLSTIYLFMKVSFSPDVIPSGWLGSKRQLTN